MIFLSINIQIHKMDKFYKKINNKAGMYGFYIMFVMLWGTIYSLNKKLFLIEKFSIEMILFLVFSF